MPNEKPPARPPEGNKKGIVQANAEVTFNKENRKQKIGRETTASNEVFQHLPNWWRPKTPTTTPMEKSATMKMGVPDAVRELAEKTVGQAERAFDACLSAAHQSVAIIPNPATEMPKKTLALTERNMKVVFDYARKLLHAKDMQEVVQIQGEFFKSLLPKSK